MAAPPLLSDLTDAPSALSSSDLCPTLHTSAFSERRTCLLCVRSLCLRESMANVREAASAMEAKAARGVLSGTQVFSGDRSGVFPRRLTHISKMQKRSTYYSTAVESGEGIKMYVNVI